MCHIIPNMTRVNCFLKKLSLGLIMQRKSIVISDIKISYLIKNESAVNTIFFIHGNSISSRTWMKQLESPLFKDYRLIAFDLPAHGESQASPHPENDYSMPGLAIVMTLAVAALVGDSPYILSGVSLGSNIVAEMLHFNIIPDGIVLAGTSVIGRKYTQEKFVKPDTHVFVALKDQSVEDEVRNYAAEEMLTSNENDVEEFVEDYYRVKFPFRSFLKSSIEQKHYSDEILLLQHVKNPILMIFGNDEQIVDPDYLDKAILNIWNDHIIKIPGASHLVNVDQPDAFNTVMADYAEEMFK